MHISHFCVDFLYTSIQDNVYQSLHTYYFYTILVYVCVVFPWYTLLHLKLCRYMWCLERMITICFPHQYIFDLYHYMYVTDKNTNLVCLKCDISVRHDHMLYHVMFRKNDNHLFPTSVYVWLISLHVCYR